MLAPCDFKNQLTGEVIIKSTWKRKATIKEAVTQTAPLKVAAQASQTAASTMDTVEQLDKAVGTERAGKMAATLNGLHYVYTGVKCDEEALAAFMETAKEEVLSVLYHGARNTAFDNYEPVWSKGTSDLTAAYTLSSPHAVEGELHALDVSWNSTGMMLAVAYGRLDTSGWCYNNGYVCVWNLLRPDVDSNSPHHTIQLDAYVTSVAFHPTSPLTLAIGTYSGEVIVVPNVAADIPQQYSSSQSSLSHREPVSQLQWVQNLMEPRDDYRYILCSASQDGTVAYWTPTNKLARPVEVHRVQNKSHLPVGVEALSYVRSMAEKGLSVPSVDGALLLGLENGDVGRGRTRFMDAEAPKKDDVVAPLSIDWLDGHRGPVQSLSTSPYFRHLFLTCSSDGSARLYNQMERFPVLSLEPSSETKHFLYDAQFSPFRPSVIALVSRSAFLHIYDLQKTSSKPSYSVEAGVDGAPVVSVSFNDAASDLLATGDTRGCVRVWRLPFELTQSTELERVAIRAAQKDGKEGAESAAEATRQLFGFSV